MGIDVTQNNQKTELLQQLNKTIMRHLSLFSGIGGFDLAAEWMGWENVAQVEIDPFCQQVLQKNFPNTKRYGDIRTFPASDYTGRIDIITGGFPCQPFSQAGNRKGTADSRHLWPEMLRVISIVKPTWIVAENVRGLLSVESGMVFEQVCTDLENEGYEVQPIIIPACAVNAPHRRDRIWFVGYSKHHGFNGTKDGQSDIERGNSYQERPQEVCESQGADSLRDNVTNTERTGYQGQEHQEGSCARHSRRSQWDKHWFEVATELCSMDDGLPVELGEFKLSKAGHRNAQIKAYGNAIVPQVAYEIFNSLNNPPQK